MFYIRYIGVMLWVLVGSLIALGLCLLRWGNVDLPRQCGRVIAWGILRILRLRVDMRGTQYMHLRPCVVVGNHQSSFDVATYGSFVTSGMVPVGKKELIWVPIFGLMFKASGSLMIDRQNSKKAMASLDTAMKRVMNEKLAIVIYPEGTRNRSGVGLLPFKRGAFHMAVAEQLPIVPIVTPSLKYWIDVGQKRLLGGVIPIEVLEPIPTAGLTRSDVEALSIRVREKMLECKERLERELGPVP